MRSITAARYLSALALGLPMACFDPSTLDGWGEGESGESVGSSSAPSTDGSSGDASDASGEGESESEGDDPTPAIPTLPADLPPAILDLALTPDPVLSAGPLMIEVTHSEDVEVIEVSELGVGLLATLAPDELPYEVPITGAKHNGERTFEVVVRDHAGLTDARQASASVDLQPTGTVVWSWEGEVKHSVVLGITPLPDGALLAGYVFTEEGPRPRISRLNSAGALVWESEPFAGLGYGVAVAVQPGGAIVAIGNRYKNDDVAAQAMWMRRFDPINGAPTPGWGADGLTGERARALALDPSGAILIAGETRANAEPLDAYIWAFGPGGDARWLAPLKLDLGLCSNEADDVALALTALAGGGALVAGDVLCTWGEDQTKVNRGIVAEIQAGGDIVRGWVDDEGAESWLRGLALADNGDVLIAGARRSDLAANPQPTAWRLRGDLEAALWSRPLATASKDAMAAAIAVNHDGEVVVASTVYDQMRVIKIAPDGQGPALWQQLLPLDVGPDRVHAMALGRYDEIHLAGEATLAGIHRAWATKLAP